MESDISGDIIKENMKYTFHIKVISCFEVQKPKTKFKYFYLMEFSIEKKNILTKH